MSRETTLPPAWAALAAAYGGVSALATALGVSASTVWRWGDGATIPRPSAIAVASLAKARRVASPVTP